MKLSRQHFKLVAEILKEYNEAANSGNQPKQVNYQALMREITINFANRLGETNALFNTERFMQASGIQE